MGNTESTKINPEINNLNNLSPYTNKLSPNSNRSSSRIKMKKIKQLTEDFLSDTFILDDEKQTQIDSPRTPDMEDHEINFIHLKPLLEKARENINIKTKGDNKYFSDFNISNTNTNINTNTNENYARNRKTVGSIKNIDNEIVKQTIRDISQFSFIKVIGKGSYGKVILAKDKITNQIYALKCVKKEILHSQKLQNLINEKKILEKIKHPFILNLHFTFQSKDKLYFAFTYYNGGELFFHLSRLKRFPEHYVKFYSAQLYLALKHLHDNNIIFRDNKPENILIDIKGNIKLIDFGLARDITKTNLASTLCGTSEYIPPEVINGYKYSFNFDWWGFGILIYELLYGYPPFRNENKYDLFNQILNDEPNFDKVEISDEAKDLIISLLKKNECERISPSDIKYHKWFKDINFGNLLKMKVEPPYKPDLKDEDDLSNIDPVFLNENIYSPIKRRIRDCDEIDVLEF